ncbi:GIY-YIG nuclease family protein [Alicyclobacillus fastidiosus]|uniref:GIY-YIG nuclease family protein n=1 Tax=Alicyclobacillus fastidiosus TaxID=392011 RepID=A0ABY6ZIX2_9BACL|nr:GIY-YIG nuclease family protein [Alicyclobacillus fastidiosus]WAH42868.1 GIY-YIG nuclease family protein [Alicyclobacillus fastidiosus]GMA64803.1 GIY-YIG domain-containing protein [Alicyclobacillus fastidiosus]
MFYVYVLECRDGTLYTGYTNDLSHRVEVHNAGRGAKYTRARTPVRLVYSEQMADKSAALRREIEIKKLARKDKLALIEQCGTTGVPPSNDDPTGP